jgi:hypothetical protein
MTISPTMSNNRTTPMIIQAQIGTPAATAFTPVGVAGDGVGTTVTAPLGVEVAGIGPCVGLRDEVATVVDEGDGTRIKLGVANVTDGPLLKDGDGDGGVDDGLGEGEGRNVGDAKVGTTADVEDGEGESVGDKGEGIGETLVEGEGAGDGARVIGVGTDTGDIVFALGIGSPGAII